MLKKRFPLPLLLALLVLACIIGIPAYRHYRQVQDQKAAEAAAAEAARLEPLRVLHEPYQDRAFFDNDAYTYIKIAYDAHIYQGNLSTPSSDGAWASSAYVITNWNDYCQLQAIVHEKQKQKAHIPWPAVDLTFDYKRAILAFGAPVEEQPFAPSITEYSTDLYQYSANPYNQPSILAPEITEDFFDGWNLAIADDCFINGAVSAGYRLETVTVKENTVHITIAKDCEPAVVADALGALFMIPVPKDCTEISVTYLEADWYDPDPDGIID